MDHSTITPADCKCRQAPLPNLVADWSKRAQDRILGVIEKGGGVNFAAVKHEAQLVASISRGGPMAFAPQHAHYGHFCESCPYRKRTPLTETLAVDRQAASR